MNLIKAHRELYGRTPDEMFETLDDLARHVIQEKERSDDLWLRPEEIEPVVIDDQVRVQLGSDGAFTLNDWSFGQVCRIAGVSKDTLNRFTPETASRALVETLPTGNKPLQLFARGDLVRSIHGTAYTRLYNADLIDLVQDVAEGFHPAQKAGTGHTGLYCGEQDLFLFLIDPTGWVEIEGEAFAPGFFLWNSEVGKRSLGIQTFWFQKVCGNHIVWDAVEVIEYSRKHTARVGDSLEEIRELILHLVDKRDQRKDSFARVIERAMKTELGDDAEEVIKILHREGIPHNLSKEALASAQEHGRFTIFAVVDALTRLSGKIKYAGDRTEADRKVSALLSLAA
jgi:hypothetical protein